MTEDERERLDFLGKAEDGPDLGDDYDSEWEAWNLRELLWEQAFRARQEQEEDDGI